MKISLIMTCLLLLFVHNLFTQTQDNFDDGDFSYNPEWFGDVDLFRVNSSGTLQLYAEGSGEATLATALSINKNYEWEVWIKHSFSPSANNHSRFYLLADSLNLSLSSKAIYIQLGEAGSEDAPELYYQSADTNTLLCRGSTAAIASSFEIRIKIRYHEDDRWEFLMDGEGGLAFLPECEHTFPFDLSSGYTGFWCTCTNSNSRKMYFDDLKVDEIHYDTEPPQLIQTSCINNNTVALTFNEPLTQNSSLTTQNYLLNGYHEPYEIVHEQDRVLLSFQTAFQHLQENSLHIERLTDLSGNEMEPTTTSFSYIEIHPYDIIINELMVDPAPAVGLPEYEYIELYNRMDYPIDLSGWKLVINGSAKEIDQLQIEANGYILLGKEEAKPEMQQYGTFYGFESFSLTNSTGKVEVWRNGGERKEARDSRVETRRKNTLNKVQNPNENPSSLEVLTSSFDSSFEVLTSSLPTLVSLVVYDDHWYGDSEKDDGGWSLEMMDPDNPCIGNGNWKASESLYGGTPGSKNLQFTMYNVEYRYSMFDVGIDHVEVRGDMVVRVYYNQQMDSASVLNPENYMISHGIGHPVRCLSDDNTYQAIDLHLEEDLSFQTVYELELSEDLCNCVGTPLEDAFYAFADPATPMEQEIVINEIMFNPADNMPEYIELYNRSDRCIDLESCCLRYINAEGTDSTTVLLSLKGHQLLSGQFAVISDQPQLIERGGCDGNALYISLENMPTLGNGGGKLEILNCQFSTVNFQRIDVMMYNDDMHHALLADHKGVALERIHYNNPGYQTDNWHSASHASAYGTPGCENSQFKETANSELDFSLDNPWFTPDNDGHNDIVSICYQLDHAGYMLNCIVFNRSGIPINQLKTEELLAQQDCFYWDGRDQSGHMVPQGNYIIFCEVWDLQGNVKRKKLLVSKLENH